MQMINNVHESDYKIIISQHFFIFLMPLNTPILFIYNDYKQGICQFDKHFPGLIKR